MKLNLEQHKLLRNRNAFNDIVYKGLQKFNLDFRTHFPHIKINSKKMEKAIDK